MQKLALASVYPRSIAWLIRSNEWDRFEEIIKYNCAMVGGYFNVIVPLTDQDSFSEEYQRFLIDYDPDLIVLAPGMPINYLDILSIPVYPFGVIPWESIAEVVSSDPIAGGTGINATMIAEWVKMISGTQRPSNAFAAVADEAHVQTSRLALVACGDVTPRTPLLDIADGNVYLDATGYREHFLEKLLKENLYQNKAGAYLQDDNELISAPNRHQLAHLIKEEYKFPLSNAVNILRACCKLQHFPSPYQSFISLTASYKAGGGTPKRVFTGERPPAIVILLSDSFDIEEATLFWNLRANGFYVAWLSFSEIKNDIEAVAKWLDSESGGIFYWMHAASDIAFSSTQKNFAQLQFVLDRLREHRYQHYPRWSILLHNDLIFYDYIRPFILQERVMVAKDELKYTFVPNLANDRFRYTGVYTVTLKWNGLMLPQDQRLVQSKISSEVVRGLLLSRKNQILTTMRLRLTKERYLKAQISTEEPLEFTRPSIQQVIETLFEAGDFVPIEQSSAAKYHTSFINRCGDLADATYYLATSPYRELLEILSDNSNKNKRGWILDNPSKRRVLHHLHLRDILGKMTPSETKNYFNTVSDELPDEAFQLLEKGLLERGFLLSCNSCSYQSWYPVERVGQTFECARCFQTQVYDTNPLWLYKLPEVIFQGFADNMQVPLLSLKCLKDMSKHCFEWVPDSNVYTQSDSKKSYRNIDILCISDGKLYIGEAKSNDEIDSDQFSFYEQVCKRVSVDGIVFATSRPHWSRGTQQRIDSLKTWFRNEILILTEKDLYPNAEEA